MLPMPPEMMKTAIDLVPASMEYEKNLKGKGKLLASYTFSGQSKGFVILNVESLEELNEIIAKEPYSLMLSFEAIPLVDFEHSLKVWKEVLERALK